MKRSYVIAILQLSLAFTPVWSCRQAPKRSEEASLAQQKGPSDQTACRIATRLSFVPRTEGASALALIGSERVAGIADDSDFSLNLVPSDFDHARSLTCTPSTCEVAITKPLTLTRESKVELTANLYLKYQSTLDEKGALISRQVAIGGKKAHISMGKVLGVDVEVGAFLKQDLQKKGFRALSSGTFVEANTTSQLPILNFRGNIVAEGLNLKDLHVKDATVAFVRSNSLEAPKDLTPNTKSELDLRDEMLRAGSKARVGKPDFTWDILADQCAEAFYVN